MGEYFEDETPAIASAMRTKNGKPVEQKEHAHIVTAYSSVGTVAHKHDNIHMSVAAAPSHRPRFTAHTQAAAYQPPFTLSPTQLIHSLLHNLPLHNTKQ